MRYELDYAQNWQTSYENIPNTYKERPSVTQWENWRNARANIEIRRWAQFIDFWMSGAYGFDFILRLGRFYQH